MATRRWISTSSTDFNTAGNWSGGAVPVDGDDVVIENSAIDIAAYNGSSIDLASLTIKQSYTGKIGDSAAYLQIGVNGICEIGRDDAGLRQPGSPRINIDLGSANVTTCTIINSCAQAADVGALPIRLKAANASTTLKIRKGLVQLAAWTSETSTIDDIEVGETGSTEQNTRLEIGTGLTMDDMTILAGYVSTRSAIDTCTMRGGKLYTEGSATIATLTMRGGYALVNTTGTIGACTLQHPNCVLDTTGANSARTFTALTIHEGVFIRHPLVTVTTLTQNTDYPTRTEQQRVL